MDLQLSGKRALVTGSTSGIGEAIVSALAAEGVSVVVHGRNLEQAERVRRDIEASGGRAVISMGDLTSDIEVERIVEECNEALGGVDILVNNAGVFPEKPWLDSTGADWMRLFDQNVASMVRLIRLFIPAMKERGWGRVVSLGSVVATMPYPTFAAYSATKAANVNLAVNLAKELTGTGVTSNVVSPGDILTPGNDVRFRQTAKDLGWSNDWEEIERRIITELAPNPAGRLGRTSEVGALVAFLCSPQAGFINGTNIRIDGGLIPTVS